MLKLDILKVGIFRDGDIDQVVLIHKLRYFFSFKQHKYHFTINNLYKHCKIIHTN